LNERSFVFIGKSSPKLLGRSVEREAAQARFTSVKDPDCDARTTTRPPLLVLPTAIPLDKSSTVGMEGFSTAAISI
jgi:hypothetical protein